MTAPTKTPSRARNATTPTRRSPVGAATPARTSRPPKPKSAASVQGTTPEQGTTSDQPAILPSEPTPPSLAGPMLALLADIVDDLERTRVANENRLRQLTRTETDSDGIDRGFGLTTDHPQVAAIAALVTGLDTLEHQAILALQRGVRQHPLGPWVKTAKGVGEKQGARLLAAIGDPYWNTLHDRPRTVSELWAYCGYHVLPSGGDISHPRHDTQSRTAGVAAARAKGQRANWSAAAKMRAYLVATSCMKGNGPYRLTYDTARLKYTDATHQVECRRCGPKGKPALAGSPLSAGHQHARALRIVAKEVLKDLWRAAKDLHEEGTT